ncbi:hypothetical protein AKO1_001276 [Acrasis kona]|uniref:Uncharacterized protein n=1 Tax=Acrasis kona TaxID=1008807 RepID=A0AAW2ZDX7_9EUKA
MNTVSNNKPADGPKMPPKIPPKIAPFVPKQAAKIVETCNVSNTLKRVREEEALPDQKKIKISIEKTTTLSNYENFIKNSNDVCVTGGAKGADYEWARAALSLHHKVFLMSFEKHAFCDVPLSSRVVRDTKSLYVVAPREDVNKKSSVAIKSGSAWAPQMFALLFSKTIAIFGRNITKQIPIYLLDTECNKWFQAEIKLQSYEIVEISWITINKPPPPSGLYTAIGSREISETHKKLINQCFIH